VPEARILVVEDETIVAMDIRGTLQRLGYDVVAVVSSGDAAVEAAAEQRPDLVLMDIRLQGGMDGVEAAVRIREKSPVPIVFLTAHADEGTLERTKLAAPYGYVLKPFDDGELSRAVELALHRHREESEQLVQAEDALWDSEERFRLLVDAVQDYAITIIDRTGRIVTWNSGAEKMTGYRAQEVIGRSASIFYLDDQVSSEEALRRDLARQSETESLELEEWRVRKDGSRFLVQSVRCPIRDRNGHISGYATVSRDVTQRRMLEAQLLQSQKLESLGKLAGGIAHDFNNMLMVIVARTELLSRLNGGAQPQQRYIEDIKTAAAKSAAMTQQLLAAARRQVLQPHVVDLNEMVRSTMRLLTPSIGEDIDIRTELDPKLWPVFADPGKLHQVLMNLALNARDAMPSGGALTIETRNFHATKAYLRQHPELKEGDHVVLVVSDNGDGMPPEVQQRIYDPFFTTKEAGTGLGLAVVRGIIEQTGGCIWLYSESGQGTTFKIFIPRQKEQSEVEAVREPSLPDDEPSETILLVEDEMLLRKIVEETLLEHGYHVLTADGPQEALTVSRNCEGTIDLLLTDVVMPKMNGRQLAEVLIQERPALKVVFMSGYTDNAIVHHGTLDPGVLFLEKPAPPQALLQIVRTALSGG